jgi:hypothetical protein
MACVTPSIGSPTVPTLDPGAVNTYIAQTAIAAATQTIAALPTFTPTATFTPTPRATETDTPTPTNTFVFLLRSPTPIIPPTLPGSSGSSSSNYACQVLTVSPANGTVYSPRTEFQAVWTVKNIGKKRWENGTIDYIYSSGDKIHKVSGYDLNKEVAVGETALITVNMEAPKNPSPYTTFWTLRAGANNFCSLMLYIIVQ